MFLSLETETTSAYLRSIDVYYSNHFDTSTLRTTLMTTIKVLVFFKHTHGR